MEYCGKFFVPIYNCEVGIYIGPNLCKEIEKAEKLHDEFEEFDEGIHKGYMYAPDDIDFYYLFINSDYFTVNIFNHEKSHLVEEILLNRDIKPIDEVRAYLDGFISEQFGLFFKSHGISPEIRASGPSLADGSDLQSRKG